MSRSKKRTSKVARASERLIRLAEEFRLLDWARVLPIDQPVAIELEPEEAGADASAAPAPRIFAVRVESHDPDPHLLLLLGDDAFPRFRAIVRTDYGPGMESIDSLELSYLVAGRVERRFLHPNIDAGREPGPTQRVPVFVARDGGRPRRVVRPAEIRRFAAALRILKEARARPNLPEPAGSALLRLTGSAAGELLAADLFELPDELAAPAVAAQLDLPDDLADLPRTDRVLAVRAIATGIPDPESGRLLSYFVARDAESGRIVAGDLYPGGPSDVPLEAWERLLRGEDPPHGAENDPYPPGLPRKIRFTDPPLFESICAELALLGIEAELDPEHPDFAEIEGFWERAIDTLDRVREASGEHTLAEWKAADIRFIEELQSVLLEGDPKQVSRLYFGTTPIPQQAIDRYGVEAVIGSFHDWLVHAHRPTPGTPTALERRLARRDLAPIDRALCEARRAGKVSWYRVKATEPGEHFDVVDIETQEEHRIHDASMSQTVPVGLILFLRLYDCGPWTLSSFAGPPVTSFDADPVAEEIERAKAEARARPDRDAESAPTDLSDVLPAIGRLWAKLVAPRPRPRIQNTSGEPLKLQVLSFRVKDPVRTEAAITARRDVERDAVAPPKRTARKSGARAPAPAPAPSAKWVWLDPRPNERLRGGPTVLGSLTLTVDRLDLDVNSDERAARARKWLERIPGVRWEKTEFLPFPGEGVGESVGESGTESDADRAGGLGSARALEVDATRETRKRGPQTRGRGRDPNPSPDSLQSDLIEQIVPTLRNRLLGWIDEKIPALGDLTPRQACKTEEGRRKVTRMIQTMQEPVGDPALAKALDFEGVRKAMLRELRLER